MAGPVVVDSQYGVQVWSMHDEGGSAYWVVDRRDDRRWRFDVEGEALKHAFSLIYERIKQV